MTHSVFISYARSASGAEAGALEEMLGEAAFLDTGAMDDGVDFPARLCEGLMGARVVVVFATGAYLERPFCRLELRLALAAGNSEGSQVVVALGDGAGAVLGALPPRLATTAWPAATETQRLAQLVRKRLKLCGAALSETLGVAEAGRIAKVFLEESRVPEPLDLRGIPRSLPEGVAGQSIGARFVGRASDLRALHRALFDGKAGGAARLTSRIAAGAGFGKTRLAIEYLHRYGPKHYPGGLFWVNAASGSLDEEFWRVLSDLDAGVGDLATMRQAGRDVRRELGRALRRIESPALFVVDNVPEAGPGEDPPAIGEFCPAVGAVTVLATSRQDTQEAGVRRFPVDTLGRDAAILLLTDGVAGAGRFSWERWGGAAEWVGDLPVALDLLNRCLALGSMTAAELIGLAEVPVVGPTAQLDGWREGLRGQVPENAVFGITETFRISFESLDKKAQRLAMTLAQWDAAPIPEELVAALGERVCGPAERTALRSRHFVTAPDDSSFGVMHRLMADFLRTRAGDKAPELIGLASLAVVRVMEPERCRNPGEWKVLNRVRPHAEVVLGRAGRDDRVAADAWTVGIHVALLARAQGDYASARRLEEQVLAARRRLLGEKHPDTVTAMNNLAITFFEQGDLESARKLQDQVLAARRRVGGKEHPDTLTAMNNLAMTMYTQGDWTGARKLQDQVLTAHHRLLGDEHQDTLRAKNNLSLTLSAQGDLAGARKLREQVVAGFRLLGEERPDTLTAMNNLATTMYRQGDLAAARKLQEQVVAVSRRLLGEEHPDTLLAVENLNAMKT